MKRSDLLRSALAGDLHRRYYPRSRVAQTLVWAAPWLNFALLLLFFLMLNGKFVLQPGCVIDLPIQPFSGGTRSAVVAVIRSVDAGRTAGVREIVYFADVPYLLEKPEDVNGLREALRHRATQLNEDNLILYADRTVNADTLMQVMNMAREVGMRSVNLASRSTGD